MNVYEVAAAIFSFAALTAFALAAIYPLIPERRE